MTTRAGKFTVLSRHPDTAPLLEQVVAAADQNKNALGFWAANVFREFAVSEQLYVAARTSTEGLTYAGHLMFKCGNAKASVLQMYVDPALRRHGVAKLLLDHLKSSLTDAGFISIYARVAEDLGEANSFWAKQGFYVQRVEPGGSSRKRTILVRSHELASPQLFAPSGVSSTNPLGLDVAAGLGAPLFLLDLNVLFDLGPRRIRNEDAVDLFRAERMGHFRFAISDELSNELQRTATPGRTDPMLAYTRIFPVFSLLPADESSNLPVELAPVVFGGKSQDQLSENDRSDLRHLATAIQHRLAGFITNDAAILAAAAAIREKYDIQVISPTAFKQSSPGAASEGAFDTPSAETLRLMPVVESDAPAVRAMLTKLSVSGSSIASEWAAVGSNDRVANRQGLWCGQQLLGYLTWPAWTPGESFVARLAVDESHNSSLDSARALLSHLLEQVATIGTVQLQIEFPPRQVYVREVAAGLGFTGTAGGASLAKVILGTIVTAGNWVQCRDALIAASRLKLPDTPPVYRHSGQQVQCLAPDGNRIHVPLDALETLLAPALFCLPGRRAVITPVQRDFSEHLLAHLPQRSLLPQSKAALFRSKHYLSSSRTLKQFKRGELLLFYESLKHQGLGAVVAIARIQQAYLKSDDMIEASDLEPSVFNAANLEMIGKSKMKTVTVFDNVIRFPRPVPLAILERIGCGRATDLITTRPITDAQLQEILSRGMTCE